MNKFGYRVTLAVSSQDGLDMEPDVHDVVIVHQDRLRAEQISARMGLPAMGDAPLTGTTLWCWAACKRLGLIDAKVSAETFLNSVCLDVENPKDEGSVGPDPTQSEDPTGSPSA